MSNDTKQVTPSLTMAILVILLPISIVLISVAVLKVGFFISLVLGTGMACLLGLKIGVPWEDLQRGIFHAHSRVSIVFMILILIGAMVAIWILSGTIPFMLFWGLKLLTVKTFLLGVFIFCCIFSVCCGTSFGTIATAGIVFVGVGNTLGVPIGWTAGAVISGGYFGDKMSPASDTTNVAASATETDLYSHISSMLYTTLPAAIVCLLVYGLYGMTINEVALPSEITKVTEALQGGFNLSPIVILPPVLFLILSIKRVPAIPTIFICMLTGMVIAAFFQHASLDTIMAVASDGYKSETGVKMVDGLLSRGGVSSMFFSVVLILLAVSLGGAMEATRSLECVVEALAKKVHSTTGLIGSVLASSYLLVIGTGDVMVALVVGARSYSKEFAKRGISSRVLSRTLEDSATISAPLMPWGVAPFFIFSMLEVTPFVYAPYAVLCYTVPVFSIICSLTGFGIFTNEKPIEREAENNSLADAETIVSG